MIISIPNSLLQTEQNIEKFKAAREFVKMSDIDEFVIITENHLNNDMLNIFCKAL